MSETERGPLDKFGKTATEEPTKEQPQLDKPMLGIDPVGNMTLFIPLHRVQEVVSRGMADICRSEILKWYAANAQKQREIAMLASKTGFQRFKDKLLKR